MAPAELLTCPPVRLCQHTPMCPTAYAIDGDAAHTVASFPEQGWSLLCNGIVLFDDTGELLPDCSVLDPRRGPAVHTLGEDPASDTVAMSGSEAVHA